MSEKLCIMAHHFEYIKKSIESEKKDIGNACSDDDQTFKHFI